LKSSIDELLTLLNKDSEEFSVVVMPDFFLDRLITLKLAPTEFITEIENVAKRKGGSIDGINQTDLRGGNAVNTASALAALGVKVTPIVCTNKHGLQQLNFFLKPLGIDMSHINIMSKASLTTALELKGEGNNTNVMLRDLGSLADFGPADLSDKDYELIKNADYVCVFNWAGTRNHGTELAQAVFHTVKKLGKGKTYLDTADPTPNREKIPEFMETILKSRLVDVLSSNENEAVTYAKQLRGDFRAELNTLSFEELAMNSARFLADQLSARIDFHTTRFSATFNGGNQVVVPAFNVKTLRATGAGDAWNAGNILADVRHLSDECRLTLANAVAACYLSNLNGEHPSREQVMHFIKESNARQFYSH